MPERRHAVESAKRCDVEGCGAEAVRSVSGKRAEKAGLSLASDPSKNAHLCRNHYREFKKKTKKDRTLERLGW
ncbi:MAG: hypothetical protein JW880_07415 [Candidatus Thermoplasmatota archaeon]|nr:hypothetical protein [Candidatus Thermoplasmatota archaeon]